jgi:hypothetical protein
MIELLFDLFPTVITNDCSIGIYQVDLILDKPSLRNVIEKTYEITFLSCVSLLLSMIYAKYASGYLCRSCLWITIDNRKGFKQVQQCLRREGTADH